MMDDLKQQVKSQMGDYLESFLELIRLKTVSTDPFYFDEIARAATWLESKMLEVGLHSVESIRIAGSHCPLVIGRTEHRPGKPHVLVYCHYDVQPAKREDGWTEEPFKPVIRDGHVIARGAADSKVHVIAWLKAIALLTKRHGELPVNFTLLFEGEEESSSVAIMSYLAGEGRKLQPDCSIISDGQIAGEDMPALVYGYRGLITGEVKVVGPKHDLHSGHFGGVTQNPIQALSQLLGGMFDREGRVTVPGFYDGVTGIDDEERNLLKEAGANFETVWESVVERPVPWGDSRFSPYERTCVLPTLEINGIYGGYTGVGVKTVLPRSARAKISCRLVPDQDPNQVLACLDRYFTENSPPSVITTFASLEDGAVPVILERSSAAMKAGAAAYEFAWGTKPIYVRSGATIPVISELVSLSKEAVLMGFSVPTSRAHGPDENIPLSCLERGIVAAVHFIEQYADVAKGA